MMKEIKQDPALIGPKSVGEMLDISKRSVDRLRDRGALPPPVQIPGSRLIKWQKSVIDKWISDGLPDYRKMTGRI